MCLRPLISTLFPYTTLFRSVSLINTQFVAVIAGHAILSAHPDKAVGILNDGVNAAQLLTCCFHPGERVFKTYHGRIWLGGDRKSTRLNSSHVAISYAVFCLKKKNIDNLCKHIDINL